MSNCNKKFDHEVFGSLTVIMYEDKPYFIANEVTSLLGYSNSSEALKYHCKSLILLNYSKMLELELDAKPRGMQIIPEKDVYRLVMRSKMAKAEDFQDWVMEDVLPTIRNTGGYLSDVDQVIKTFYSHVDPATQAVIRAGLEYQKANQHKVEFSDNVQEAEGHKVMNEVAKHFGVGRNKLFEELRRLKILMKNNTPYQTYIDQGFFKVVLKTHQSRTYSVTTVSGKGEVWLHKKLKESGFL